MDEFDEPLPSWAISKSNGCYMEIGAQLRTRDGRKIGNAVVVSVDEAGAIIVTDAGSRMPLTESELEGLFYPPEWINDLNSFPGIKAMKNRKEKYVY